MRDGGVGLVSAVVGEFWGLVGKDSGFRGDGFGLSREQALANSAAGRGEI